MKDPRKTLQEHLSERVAINPQYSLRAFARDLDLSPQLLSNFINGKKGFSEKMALKVAGRLGLREIEQSLFCESSRALFGRSKAARTIAKVKYEDLSAKSLNEKTTHLEINLFKIISNWYHLALIELIKISKKSDAKTSFFSKRLGISENEVELALGRLERLELISKKTGGGWTINQDTIIADQGITPESVRNFHRQVIQKAMTAIATQSEQERYGSSSVLPLRVKDFSRAKKIIQDFRIQLAKEVSSDEEGEEIFALSIHFFKISETILPDSSSRK